MILQTVCGTEFEIDDEDYPLVEGATFSLMGVYVYVSGGRAGVYTGYLHKLFMPDRECDHIDKNKMNNRRGNLDYVTRSENMHNREPWGQFPKGITYDWNKDLYRARIQINGKRVGLGRYKNLEDAVAAYNSAAAKYYGDKACPTVL